MQVGYLCMGMVPGSHEGFYSPPVVVVVVVDNQQ